MNPDSSFYKHNYDGFERLATFSSREALDRYRSNLLIKSHDETEFIIRHIGTHRLRALEFCCGNGRLLMALAKHNALSYGLGIEMSPDRVRFSQQWITDTAVENVEFTQGDVLHFQPEGVEPFDLAICITGAFGYFRVIDPDAPDRVLENARRALKPNGHLLLELFQLTDDFRHLLRLNDGHTRTWRPLPPSDPFAYQLDEFEYSEKTRVLKREKTFIGRDGTIDAGRAEYVADHTPSEIREMAAGQGFSVVSTYADFADTPYQPGKASRLIQILRRT